MQWQRNGDRALEVRSVTGLGICDALRVELEPVQVPWFVDEVEETCRAREETYVVVRRSGAEQHDVAAADYRVRELQLIRRQIDDAVAGERIVVFGPGMTMSELIRGSMRHAISSLAELAESGNVSDLGAQTRLAETAAAAVAWIATFRDAQSVEWYSFDPDAGL
jgi:hypothetical protein